MNRSAKPGQQAAQRVLIPELIQIICQDASPSVLARLSQAHSSFKEEAERRLYHRIYINGKTADIFCLATLTVNLKKALFVKSLTFHYNGDGDLTVNAMALTLPSLTGALRNMRALTDLRIRLYIRLNDGHSEQLSQVLKGGHFQLCTLFCNSSIDLEGVLKMHPKLRILGLFEWMDFPQATFEVIGLLTKRDPSRRTWPYIICIDENDKPFFTTSIFAPFFSDAYATYQPIVESIDEYYARDLQLTREMVRGVTVYLKDFSNMTYVCDIADLAATYFPELRVINMLVLDESYKFQPTERFKNILSRLTELERLRFGQWDGGNGPSDCWSLEEQVSVAQQWRSVSHSLTEVVFSGDEAVVHDPWIPGWDISLFDPEDVLWW